MKLQNLALVIAILFSINTFAQQNPEVINANEQIQKGLKLYEEQKYEEALVEYQKISENDTAYVTSIVEQILAYYQLKQYDKGVEAGKKALSHQLDLSPELFINIGSCYDNLNKYEEAVKIYDQGIKIFPVNNLLFFNKAYSLSNLKKYKESLDCYIKSAQLNPFHGRTHYMLGKIAMNEGKTTLAILAFQTFIIIDPNSSFANDAIVCINDMATSKYKEKIKPNNVDITDGDDFSEIDILLENYIALDKKYKIDSKLEFPFVKQSHLVFEKLPENPDTKGFWYKMYVPFYKQLLKDGKFDVFAHYMLIPSGNEYHKKLVEKNRPRFNPYIEWVKTVWDDKHREIELNFNGKTQNVVVYRVNRRFAISSVGTFNADKTNIVGYSEGYHASGKLKLKGNLNNEGKRDGEWIWYLENGNLNSKELYVNNQVVSYEDFNKMGIISTNIPYKDGKINGIAYAYSKFGSKQKLITFATGVRDGNYEEYYPNGQIAGKGTNKNGKYNGKYQTFYDSGELESEVNLIDGLKEGEEILYHRNGKIMQKVKYIKGKYDGEFLKYFDNGQISQTFNYLNGNQVGKNISYYRNGVIEETSETDENGKITGFSKEYDIDGKIYREFEFKKGEIIAYKYYNKKGEIIKQDLKKSGDFQFEGYHTNGALLNNGVWRNDSKQGEWKYYNKYGKLEAIENYANGTTEGEYKSYFVNGKIDKQYQNKEGEVDGYYIEFHKDGNIYSEGNYSKGEQVGKWFYYHQNKNISNEQFYINGELHGTQKFYSIDGKLRESNEHYNGIILNSKNYDTLGNIIDSIGYKNASGKLQYHFSKNGALKIDANVEFGNYVGDYISYHPNGKLNTKGQYFNGNKNGVWTWYTWNGNISSTGSYNYDNETGTWKYFYEDGKIKTTTEYLNGSKNGKQTWYFENGAKETEKEYLDDDLEGLAVFYTQDGQIEHKRMYLHNQFLSYSYFEPSGNEKTIEIKPGKNDVKIYYKNGQLAREFTLVDGQYQGEYKEYFQDGKVKEITNYLDNDLINENLIYFSNGKLKEKNNYYFDELNGQREIYYEDGKLKTKSNFIIGKLHGKTYHYDKTGKLKTVLNYQNDVLVDIKEF